MPEFRGQRSFMKIVGSTRYVKRYTGLPCWKLVGPCFCRPSRASIAFSTGNFGRYTHDVPFKANSEDNTSHGRSKARTLTTSHGDGSTIYAVSTAPGRAAIAIVRISGPECSNIYRSLCPGTSDPTPRHAYLRTLYHPNDRSVLDPGALVLYFPTPKTATGEDVLELHIHGGHAIVRAVLAAIPRTKSVTIGAADPIRFAEPGEFTRRAFYNDRLDLTQVEALGDALVAETEQQRRLAVRGTGNSLLERYEFWRSQLLYARGELEALIDFSEDQHFDESPKELIASVAKQIQRLHIQVQASIRNALKGELLRNGIKIALLGAPNAGKSSLLNRIVGREAAIVSREAGTTRDVVEVNVDIGGFFCKFGDLAGLRWDHVKGGGAKQPVSIIGEVEQEGIRRAKQWILAADVVIVVLPVEQTEDKPPSLKVSVATAIAETLTQCDPQRQSLLFAINKVDLVHPNDELDVSEVHILLHTVNPNTNHTSKINIDQTPLNRISCKPTQHPTPNNPDPSGIQALLATLTTTFTRMTTAETPSDPTHPSSLSESLSASERHRLLLLQCQHHLADFLTTADHDDEPDTSATSTAEEPDADIVLAAESLRAAAECLARITGRGESGDVEEVLGVVFEKFCVGK